MIKRTAFLLCASIFALSGCGGGGGIGSLLGGGAGCSPTSFSMNFPADAGFSASGTINSAYKCFSTATVNTYTSLLPIGSAFTSANGVTVLYLGMTFSSTEYATGLPSLNITLPAGMATAGRQFYIAGNSNGGAFGWNPALEGPVTANGSTVSFGIGGGNTTFDANVEEVMALYYVP